MEKNWNFEEGLRRHLQKCELEYRAKHLPMGSEVEWLTPMCNSVEDIAAFLRELGFRVAEAVNEQDCDGDWCCWVGTTSGIIVYVNDGCGEGFVALSAQKG